MRGEVTLLASLTLGQGLLVPPEVVRYTETAWFVSRSSANHGKKN